MPSSCTDAPHDKNAPDRTVRLRSVPYPALQPAAGHSVSLLHSRSCYFHTAQSHQPSIDVACSAPISIRHKTTYEYKTATVSLHRMQWQDWFSSCIAQSRHHGTPRSLATYVTRSPTNYVFECITSGSSYAPRYLADTVVQTASVSSYLRHMNTKSGSSFQYKKPQITL